MLRAARSAGSLRTLVRRCRDADGVELPRRHAAHRRRRTMDGVLPRVDPVRRRRDPCRADERRPARAAGDPQLLFKASEARWARPFAGFEELSDGPPPPHLVTDGPFLHRTPGGQLVMLWSSLGDGGYATGVARSTTGTLHWAWRTTSSRSGPTTAVTACCSGPSTASSTWRCTSRTRPRMSGRLRTARRGAPDRVERDGRPVTVGDDSMIGDGQTVLLWNGVPPGSESWTHQEQIGRSMGDAPVSFVRNVVQRGSRRSSPGPNGPGGDRVPRLGADDLELMLFGKQVEGWAGSTSPNDSRTPRSPRFRRGSWRSFDRELPRRRDRVHRSDSLVTSMRHSPERSTTSSSDGAGGLLRL